MFDRWRKLAKAFYSEKKNQFDISKVGPGWCGAVRGVRGVRQACKPVHCCTWHLAVEAASRSPTPAH